MLLYFILLCLSRELTHTAALPLTFKLSNRCFFETLNPSSCICPEERSVWDIVWNCLATIFACSWVSVHPNLPAPDDSPTRVALRRTELMFWAVIAPEMIIFWAIRQWLAARKLARRWQEKNWTKTHGYFIQMGGFMLYKDGEPQGVLSPERLEDLYARGAIEFPTVTEKEIQDRSKADALSKLLAIGQTTWFMAQCLARAVQGLEVTQLELLTVALAFLNAFIYYFWWNKPFAVQSLVPVYLLDVPPKEKEGQRAVAPDVLPHSESIKDSSSNLPTEPTPTGDEVPTTLVLPPFKTSSARSETQNSRTFFRNLARSAANLASSAARRTRKFVKEKGYLRALYTICILAPLRLGVVVLTRLEDMAESAHSQYIHDGQMRVAAYYAAPTSSLLELRQIFATVCAIAAAFGAIHCAGWVLIFPSHPEAWIWRTSSLVIAATPLLLPPAHLLYWYKEHLEPEALVAYILENVANIFGALCLCMLPLYVVARVALLVEAFIGLRALAPGALAVVEWTTFIPHI